MKSESKDKRPGTGRGVQSRLRALGTSGGLLAKVAVVTLALALLALELLAHNALGYVPKHGVACHRGYVTKHRVVKRHDHRRRVRVCVKRHSGATPSPSRRTVLHAHLDPTFTRDPSDPFRVTYQFSASATSEAVASASASSVEEPAPLPSGVLALYSDGSLECAINVGGAVNEGKCPVTYKTLGQHRVTTIYTSGEQSATATELEQIEPFPTHATVSATFEPQPPHEEEVTFPEKTFDGGTEFESETVYHAGTLIFAAGGGARVVCGPAVDGGSPPPVTLPPVPPADCESGTAPVYVKPGGDEFLLRLGTPSSARLASFGDAWEPLSAYQSGEYGVWAVVHPPAGYAPSEATAPVQFSPTLPGRWETGAEGTLFTEPQFVQAFSAEYDKQTGEGTPLHVRPDMFGGRSICWVQVRVDGSPLSPTDHGGGVRDFPGLPAGPVSIELWVSTDPEIGGEPCEVWGTVYASE